MTLGQQMKRHISDCPGLPILPEKSSQDSAHGGSSPMKRAHGSSGSKSKDRGSKHRHQPNKSQLAETASQEDVHSQHKPREHRWIIASPLWWEEESEEDAQEEVHLSVLQRLSHFFITHFMLHSCSLFLNKLVPCSSMLVIIDLFTQQRKYPSFSVVARLRNANVYVVKCQSRVSETSKEFTKFKS